MTVPGRPFPPASREVPVIGQGTWQMDKDGDAGVEALRRGLDLGMTHIDTAEIYGNGQAEMLVGQAIKGRRDEVFLASKVHPGNASGEAMIRSCEASLQRLGTGHLDLYLLHWPSRHPLESTIAGFDELERSGKILSFGFSNFDAADLGKAIALAGPGRIACNQVLYHLRERAIEHSVLPFCEHHMVAVVGYSPFEQGAFRDGDPVLEGIARSHGATPRQVALAFLTRREALFTIPKASSAAHVEENAGAATLALTDHDLACIEEAFPLRQGKRLPML